MGYANGSSHYYYPSVTFQDFEGQGRAEKLSRIIITLFGTVGLVWGYIIQQFSQTVYILIAGVLLASIVSSTNGILFGKSNTICFTIFIWFARVQLTIPPWPIYRKKPLNWQKPRPDSQTAQSAGDETKKKKKN